MTKLTVTPEELKNQYLKDKISIKALAEKYKCCTKTISVRLHETDCEIRKGGKFPKMIWHEDKKFL